MIRTYINVVLAALGVLLGSFVPSSAGGLHSLLQERTVDGSRGERLATPSGLKLSFEVLKKKRSDFSAGGHAPAIAVSTPFAVFDSYVSLSFEPVAPVRAGLRSVTSAQPRAPPAGTSTRAA